MLETEPSYLGLRWQDNCTLHSNFQTFFSGESEETIHQTKYLVVAVLLLLVRLYINKHKYVKI